jgi:urease accessory protein
VTVLVSDILGHGDEPRFAERRRELLAILSEEAQRRRLRRTTAEGTEVAIDLPRGSFLRQSAVLHDDGERIILVERTPEAALVVRFEPALPAQLLLEQAVRVGHWAGNQHLLVETADHEIRIRIGTTPQLMLRSARGLDLQGARIDVAGVRFALHDAPARPHAHE